MIKHIKLVSCRFRTYPVVIIVVVITFAFSNLLLFYFLVGNPQRFEVTEPIMWETEFLTILQQNFRLMGSEWRLSPSPINLIPKPLDELNCTSLHGLRYKQFVATGWTKATYRIVIDDAAIAMKNVNMNGHDISDCVAKEYSSLHQCYIKAATKLLKEIVRLKVMQHPNVIKLLGYCIPEKPDVNAGKWIGIMTELGEPVDVIKLLQMTWKERLKLSLEIARLIYYLSHTPFGPVALNDFRRQQFIFIRGNLKLIDVDDISTEEPVCDKDSCCVGPLHNKSSNCVSCEHHTCKGYNEMLNILNAGKHFIRHILPYGVPSELSFLVSAINNAYEKGSWNVMKILQETEQLSRRYVNRLLNNTTTT